MSKKEKLIVIIVIASRLQADTQSLLEFSLKEK